MSNGIPTPPTMWTSEMGGAPRTLAEAQAAINNGNCLGGAPQTRVHIYETALQSIFNWLKTTATGLGAERSVSHGTAIYYEWYCFEDTNSQETRELELSRSLRLDDKCILHITSVIQRQRKVDRNWVKWTVTTTSRDDKQSTAVNYAVGTFIAILGLPAAGVGALVLFAGGATIDLGDLLKDLTAKSVFVSRETAGPETVWIDEGQPSSSLLGSHQLDPMLCRLLHEGLPGIGDSQGIKFDTKGQSD